MQIRRLVPSDKSDFMELEKLAFAGDEMDASKFEDKCANEHFVGLFIEDNLAGYLLLKPGIDYSHLNRIAVHPTFQGQGYGTKLMEYALQVLRSYDTNAVGLYVETKNNEAINLYRKFEFVIQFESWHYIIPVPKFQENHPQIQHDYEIRPLYIADLWDILNTFPDLKKDLLLDWMIKPGSNIFLGLFDNTNLQLFARFNRNFSGCFPFKLTRTSYAVPFVKHIIDNYKREDRDYIRLTCDAYSELATIFNEEGYELYHHLYKMERNLK